MASAELLASRALKFGGSQGVSVSPVPYAYPEFSCCYKIFCPGCINLVPTWLRSARLPLCLDGAEER